MHRPMGARRQGPGVSQQQQQHDGAPPPATATDYKLEVGNHSRSASSTSLPSLDSNLSVEAMRLGLLSLSSSNQSGTQDSLWESLHVFLSAFVSRPDLPVSGFPALLKEVLESDQSGHEPQASTSRELSPAKLDARSRSATLLTDTLLDVIWAVDLELDTKRDTADAVNVSDLSLAGTDQPASETLDEQRGTAKSRLVDIMRDLLSQGILSRSTVSERLEVPLLVHVGLVEDEQVFNKRGVRINTTTLYKQQKFNLLREENEGFSGLINEVVGGMGPSIRPVWVESGKKTRVVEQESAEDRNRRARRVMNNISALIGYFDMDPNRVLDVVLDIFSTNVVRHWPFFLALLAASPWGKGKGKAHESTPNGLESINLDFRGHDNFGPIDVGMNGEVGHSVIAQVLGFKYSHYQQQDVHDKEPEELYLMTAILIREGYVRFIDLFTHLTPDHKGMVSLHEKYKQSISDKVMSAKGNALTMAAPLTEEGAESSTANGSGKKENRASSGEEALKEPPNQVLGLLKALLGTGNLQCALFILGRYPWLCGAYTNVADSYTRLLNRIIEPAYSTIAISTLVPEASNPSLTIAKLRYDSKRQELVGMPSPILHLTHFAPEPLATATSRFVYFFAPWQRGLPSCNTSSFLGEFVPLLRIVGPHLYRDAILFQRICRLTNAGLRRSAIRGNSDQAAWLEVLRNLLLPALSMASGNSGLVSEVWVILRQLPYTQRYNLYGEWKYALYRRPELRARQAETEKEAKGILKRISSDNVKLSGRSLAKSSHTNPTIFFTVALNQIQSYSNLIAPIVESAKYLTHFEYDVFGFNLIDALSNPEKERTKQDGTSVSMWLQSLAAFTGTLYKRYAMMDCSPILQYIANQLKENNSKDLVIVRELILKMAGIEPLANLSDTQVAALTGGRLLRMEAMMMANAGIVTPTRLQLRKSGTRLMLALDESGMGMPLLVLIAQQRQACVHLVDSAEAHLKYLGNLFDTCQEILFQYVEFLHNQLEPQAYSELVPTVKDFSSRFSVEPAIAFHIARPRLVLKLRMIEAKDREEKLRKEVLASKSKKETSPVENSEGINAVVEEVAKPESGEQSEERQKNEMHIDEVSGDAKQKEIRDVEMVDGDGQSAPAEVSAASEVAAQQPVEAKNLDKEADKRESELGPIWKEGLEEAFEAADTILSDEAKDAIGIYFYSSFWQLSLADIAVPSERYEQEIRSLQQIIDQNPEGGRKSNSKTRLLAQDMLAQFRTELREQMLHHHNTRKRLQREKDHWFEGKDRLKNVLQLMQHCFVPRAMLSPTDALFAGRFLRMMHNVGTRNFSSLTAYDKIFTDQTTPLVFSCTENEVRNYARFLQVVLQDLNVWFKDEQRYIKEAYGDELPGFQMKWADRRGGEAIPRSDLLPYDKFRIVTNKWHSILKNLFSECLASTEYMRIRNTIVIMTRIAPQFPLWEIHGNELVDAVTTMTRDEERGDLKILGQGLLATLKKQQKTWIGVKKKVVAAPAATSASASAAPSPAPAPIPSAPTTSSTQAQQQAASGAQEHMKTSSAEEAAMPPSKNADADQRGGEESDPPSRLTRDRRSGEDGSIGRDLREAALSSLLKADHGRRAGEDSETRPRIKEHGAPPSLELKEKGASSSKADESRRGGDESDKRPRSIRDRVGEEDRSAGKDLNGSVASSSSQMNDSRRGEEADRRSRSGRDQDKLMGRESRNAAALSSSKASDYRRGGEEPMKGPRSSRDRFNEEERHRNRDLREAAASPMPRADEDGKGGGEESSKRPRSSHDRVGEEVRPTGRDPNGTSASLSSRPNDSRRSGEEPNKRPRISRDRYGEDDRPSGRDAERKSLRDDLLEHRTSGTSTPTTEGPSSRVASQGISIHGQARSSGPPSFPRRDSRNAPYGRDEHHTQSRSDRDRATSGHRAGRNGSERAQYVDSRTEKERSQRRRDRRSGHE